MKKIQVTITYDVPEEMDNQAIGELLDMEFGPDLVVWCYA